MSLYHMGAEVRPEPDSTEMFIETISLPIAEVPKNYEPHCGWRIMTGNMRQNQWARVVYRDEVEEQL